MFEEIEENNNDITSDNNTITIEALYNKYRPKDFEDIVGQEVPIQTLSNALLSGNVANAYLFSGDRGTGKTSTARIFAKSLLCLNHPAHQADGCGQCRACTFMDEGKFVDFIEIDAASNSGVQNIRDLIYQLNISPVISDKKIVLIDEAHLLSSSAASALLKELEEPPKNVVFLLATTDPLKIYPTIRSRCQWLRFQKLSIPQITERLEQILNEENIQAEDGVTTLVARQSQGGLRDAISELSKLITYAAENGQNNYITMEIAEKCFGTVSQATLMKLCNYVLDDSLTNILSFPQLISQGKADGTISEVLLSFGDILSSALLKNQGLELSFYDIGYGELLEPLINRFAQEWNTTRLLYARDIIERNWWKMENASFDDANVFCEIMILIMKPEVDWKVSKNLLSEDISQETATIEKKIDQNSEANKIMIQLLKTLVKNTRND